MAESFDPTEQHQAVVRSWHGRDAEEASLLHRQSPALIAPSSLARHVMAARPVGYVLTKEVLATVDTRNSRICGHSLDRRVRVHLPNGTQIGLAGVGEGDERLTFPSHFQVGEALQSPHWIRFAEPSDGTSKWYVVLDSDRLPKAIVYKDGTAAFEGQPIGMKGEWVTALVQPPTQPPITDRICLDVSGEKTPPTPGSASYDSRRYVR